MHFHYKHMEEFGFKILGLSTRSRNNCLNYVKYFDDKHSLISFSNISGNKVSVYKLTPEQYVNFKEGKFTLSSDGKGSGRTPSGYPVKNYGFHQIYAGPELRYKRQLKAYLDIAEQLILV